MTKNKTSQPILIRKGHGKTRSLTLVMRDRASLSPSHSRSSSSANPRRTSPRSHLGKISDKLKESLSRTSPPRLSRDRSTRDSSGSEGSDDVSSRSKSPEKKKSKRESVHAKNPSRGSDVYLSYHDIRLTLDDVESLSKNDWLTDSVIAWYEEYLEHETLPSFPTSRIVLLRPTMAQMLYHTSDPSTLKSALPNFNSVSHIFLPINDNKNTLQAEGGSHWSLLVVSVHDLASFHYDSLGSANESVAEAVSAKLGRLLGKKLTFRDLTDSPQQVNLSDCGVFVCVNMRHLLVNRLLKRQMAEQVSMSMGNRVVPAPKVRKDMRALIEVQRREGMERERRSLGDEEGESDGR